jgi:CHAD domain-containing protein
VRTGHAAAEHAPPRAAAASRLSGPEAPSSTLAAVLAALGSRFLDTARRCRDCDDAAAIHDARVAARRLETALATWRDAIDPGAKRRARRSLRRWRRRMAQARDLEVVVEALAEDGFAGTVAEAAHLARLRASLAIRRNRVRRDIANRLTPARLERLRVRLELAVVSAAPASDAIPTATRRCARAQRNAETAVEAAWSVDDDRALHAARIAVKKRRYAEEALAAGTGAPPAEASASVRALQRALGAVHDRAQVRDQLRASAERARGRNRPERALALASVALRADQLRLEALARFRSLRLPRPAAG